MKDNDNTNNVKLFENLAYESAKWTGSAWAFLIALGLTFLWVITGPVFHYSDSWQLVMNTVSSVVTFLMVFLLQRSQNRDSLAMQIKLNEIIAALHGANNKLINIEELSEEEILNLRRRYQELAATLKNDGPVTNINSISPSHNDSKDGLEDAVTV